MRLARLLCALVSGLPACDGARDVDFAGEPLFVARGESHPVTFATPRAVEVGLFWVGPDGVLHQAEHVAIDLGAPPDFALGVLTPPPAEVLREVGGRPLALGEVAAWDDRDRDRVHDRDELVLGTAEVLIGFAPDGVDGDFSDLPSGFSLVMSSGPCDLRPQSFHVARSPLTLTVGDQFEPRLRWSSPECLAAHLELGDSLVSWMRAGRWICRFGGGAAFCDEVLYEYFPEGATPAVCDAWRATRCTLFVSRCDDEHAVCVAGEPPSPEPCDLACACARGEARCLDKGLGPEHCTQKFARCVWTEDLPR